MKLKKIFDKLFWLVFIDLKRNKLWSILKILLIVLFDLTVVGLIFTIDLNIISPEKPWFKILIIYISVLYLVSFFTLSFITGYRREKEFGLLRSFGAKKSEVFLLILCEGVLLNFLSFLLVLPAGIIIILEYKLKISGIFQIAFDFHFWLKYFLSTVLALFTGTVAFSISSIPSAVYFSTIEPYKILNI